MYSIMNTSPDEQGSQHAHSRVNRPVVRIACTSDTHNEDVTAKVPAGDVLIHAGDMANFGYYEELRIAFDWISQLPHSIKVIVPGKKV
jgi:3',5'-cyclic AMP phosphodiesterase CpdA